MNNKNLQTEAEEIEFLTADEQRISRLVGTLEKVSAPNDFEFRLKARIAGGKDESYRTGSRQLLRYLLPVGASAFVLAFVLYGTNFFAPQPVENLGITIPTKSEEVDVQRTETPSNIVVAVSNSNKAEDLPVNSVGRQELPQKNSEAPRYISDAETPKKKVFPKKSLEDDGGGFRDSTVTTAPVTLPFNLDPNKKIDKPQEFDKPQALSTEQILNNIGIETVSEDNKLKVKSIRQNSFAELSGVKDGDVIEAIDNQKVSESGKSRNLSGVKKLTVLRDGKSITIDLKLN